MRETIQSTNLYGGYDFKYRIKCDICGEYIMNPTRRGKDCTPREFLTCGEDDLCAISKGWSLLEGGGACCPKCREELAAKRIVA